VLVGALGAMLAHAVAGRLPDDVLASILGPDHGRGLGSAALAAYSQTLRVGMSPIFHTIAVMAAVGAALSWAFPENRVAR